MNFTQQRPEKQGYYWYIDTTYQVPAIGFIGPMRKFYDSRWNEFDVDSLNAHKYFRFGDLIETPIVENIILAP